MIRIFSINSPYSCVADDERTKVRGIITGEGLFDGTITTQFEEFYVEPLSRYREPSAAAADLHTVVYRISDVVQPRSPLCAISNSLTGAQKPTDMNTIAHRSKSGTRQQPDQSKWSPLDSRWRAELPAPTSTGQPADSGRPVERPKRSATAADSDSRWPNFEKLFAHPVGSRSEKSEALQFVLSATGAPYQTLASRPPVLSATFGSLPPRMGAPLSVPTAPHHQQRGAVVDFGGNADGSFYDLDGVNVAPGGGQQPTMLDDEGGRYEFNDEHPSRGRTPRNDSPRAEINGHWRPKSGLIDSVFRYANLTKSSKAFPPAAPSIVHKSSPKILVGNGIDESRPNSIIMADDGLELHARKRAVVDPRKTTCMLYLQADHLFFEKYGTEETCIEVMTRHVQRVNSIYRNTGALAGSLHSGCS